MPTESTTTTLAERVKLEALAQNVQSLLGKFSSAFCGIGLSVLLGVDPLPRLAPLEAVLADNRLGAGLLAAIILIIGVGSFLVTQRSARKRQRRLTPNNATHPFLHILRVLGESVVEIIIGFLAGLFLGIGSVPSTIPLIALIRNHPPIGIGLGGVLLLILILAPLIGGAEERDAEEANAAAGAEGAAHKSLFTKPSVRLWFSTATSLTCLVLLFTLFGMITIRPAWCPNSICPAPVELVVTNKNGVNDGVMESYYLAQQSASYALTQAPSAYSFSNPPSSVGAVELTTSPSVYRAIIGIHSLQRNTRYGLILDSVDVILDKATPITGPVGVFDQGTNLVYNHQIFTFTYISQPAPLTLSTQAPAATITLEVGGSDELAVQVVAHSEVALQFHLQVHYHQIVGGGVSKTLTVPHEFAVDFIAPAHWRPYIFSGGTMVPQS